MNFINYISVACILIVSYAAGSQVNYGKITYERKTNLHKKFPMSKEWIDDHEKIKIEVFELYFTDSLSAFKPEENDLNEDYDWLTTKNSVYQDLKKHTTLAKKSFWNESFLIENPARKLHWKITDNKRSICGYQCRKAIWKPNDSTSIYAWFCTEIMPSIGPESFLGLPGAILGMATEDGGVIYFAKRVEIIKPDITTLTYKKNKQKIYNLIELKTQLQKDFKNKKASQELIYDTFEIW